MSSSKGFFMVLLMFILTSAVALGQSEYGTSNDKYIQLLRSDLKAERVAIITEVMELTDQEGEIFWPIYKEYEFEFDKLGDERIALIKDYAAHFESLTDEKAKELMDRAFKLDENKLKLDKKYFKKMDKELPTKTAAKFMQLENQINLLIRLQIASTLPLME